MTMQSRSVPSGMASLWDMNQQSFGNTERTLRAWFAISGRVQKQATQFMNTRWTKDTAALAQLGQCKTPVDALDVQMAYLRAAFEDYVSEGQKIVDFCDDVARESLPEMFGQQAPSTGGKSKRSAHRASH
ncbi:MAG: phasin family protein [Vicinamibacterales bacterium]